MTRETADTFHSVKNLKFEEKKQYKNDNQKWLMALLTVLKFIKVGISL